jgi:hypothetical protein
MEKYNPEYPPGFLEACEKYPADDAEPDPGSVTEIWDELDLWREYEQGLPKLKKRLSPYALKCELERTNESVEEFKARILKAVIESDCAYLKNLLKAVSLDRRPQWKVHGIRAAIEAFDQLFIQKGLESKDDWPTKQELRQRAEEILRKAGRALPGERQWPRILKAAGLSKLRPAPWGRSLHTRAYYLRITTPTKPLYKIGITNRTLAERFPFDSTKITVLKTWDFKKGSDAYEFEQKLLSENASELYHGPAFLHDGNDELFTRDILELDQPN